MGLFCNCKQQRLNNLEKKMSMHERDILNINKSIHDNFIKLLELRVDTNRAIRALIKEKEITNERKNI